MGRSRATESVKKYILENCKGRVLDLGCGTQRYSHLFKGSYIGLDINSKYFKKNENFEDDRYFICGDGALLPFNNNQFESVFTIGFFHHIDPISTQNIFKEIIRVSSPSANILVIDAFYPENRFDLLGYSLISMDRGKHIRTKDIFLRELEDFFTVNSFSHIKNSYPYNLYAFFLKNKKV